MPLLRYRGNRPRTIVGPSTGKEYACRYGETVEVVQPDAEPLLRMRKSNCDCCGGSLFRLVSR
jgi:hypothetical protein